MDFEFYYVGIFLLLALMIFLINLVVIRLFSVGKLDMEKVLIPFFMVLSSSSIVYFLFSSQYLLGLIFYIIIVVVFSVLIIRVTKKHFSEELEYFNNNLDVCFVRIMCSLTGNSSIELDLLQGPTTNDTLRNVPDTLNVTNFYVKKTEYSAENKRYKTFYLKEGNYRANAKFSTKIKDEIVAKEQIIDFIVEPMKYYELRYNKSTDTYKLANKKMPYNLAYLFKVLRKKNKKLR